MMQMDEKMYEQAGDSQYLQQQHAEHISMAYSQPMMPSHPWVPLEDHYNMVDERTIQPDYFIDKPPDANYIKEAEGKEKAIQVANIDPGLWDYEVEVEPVLQVLCGKALE